MLRPLSVVFERIGFKVLEWACNSCAYSLTLRFPSVYCSLILDLSRKFLPCLKLNRRTVCAGLPVSDLYL